MEPHLICLDLDGTLLRTDKTISKRTEAVIQALKEKGHLIMIATGRPYRVSKEYYRQLRLETPIVNFNGAYVHHPDDPGWGVYHTPIPLPVVENILRTCEAFHLQNIIVEHMDDVYIKNHDAALTESFKVNVGQLQIGPIFETLKTDPTCVLIQTENGETERLLKALDTQYTDAVHQRSWGNPSNIIEIIRNGVNKAVGIKRVAEYYHIPRERIIAFGDEDNDLEMLAYAGRGIAMGNAAERIKQVADDVTLTNDEDGIAAYLERLL